MQNTMLTGYSVKNSNALTSYVYNGNSIHFERSQNEVLINLTEMARPFPNKNLTQIVNSLEIQDYLVSLSKLQNYSFIDLLQVRKGAPHLGGGTWANRKIALRVAQKLNPDFAVWVDTKIEELLTSGVATVNNDDDTIALAMSILQKRLEENKRKLEESKNHVILLEATNKQLLPKAQYTEEVLQSTSTFTTTQMADDLGMSAKALNAKLADLGIQYKQSGQWHLKALYTGKGYTDIRVSKYSENKTAQSMVWTELGRLFLTNLRKSGKL